MTIQLSLVVFTVSFIFCLLQFAVVVLAPVSQTRLAVFSHYTDPHDLVSLTRKTYAGPLELGEDLMTIDIGDKVEVRRAAE